MVFTVKIQMCPTSASVLCHRLRIHRCATRGISCLTWMAWIRHTHAHFWQVQMQDFIKLIKRQNAFSRNTFILKFERMYLPEMRGEMTYSSDSEIICEVYRVAHLCILNL